jgi:hypothetical protein
VQEPDVGWDTLTVVAVTGRPKADVDDEDEDEVGLPNAEMHDPTVTLEAAAVTVWSNVVVGVYVTVVCPVVGFCTSRDAPLMAAMVPDVPGKVRAPPPAPPLPPAVEAGAEVEEVVEAEDDEPQAASVTAATPRAERATARRSGVFHRWARRPAPERGGFGFSVVVLVVVMGLPWSA